MPEINSSDHSAIAALRHWDAVAPAWDAYRNRLFEDVRTVSEWLVEQIQPQEGPGETGFLAAARRGADERRLANVECRVTDAQQIDLPDDSVDGVVSQFGLMLMPDQERAITEIRRVLRPGGRCAYATWGPPDRNPWIFQIVAALLQSGLFSLSTPERNHDLLGAGGFPDATVEELTGVMRYHSPDDYWTFVIAVSGPLAELVDALDTGQVQALRARLEPSLAPYEHDGALELPWTAMVTRTV